MGLFCMPKNLGNSSKADLIEAAIKNLELFQKLMIPVMTTYYHSLLNLLRKRKNLLIKREKI